MRDDEGAIVSDQEHETPARTDAAGGGKDMTRGQFLTAATLGVGGIMGALIAVPVAGMALAPVFGGSDFEAVFIGKIDESKDGVLWPKVVLHPHADKLRRLRSQEGRIRPPKCEAR